MVTAISLEISNESSIYSIGIDPLIVSSINAKHKIRTCFVKHEMCSNLNLKKKLWIFRAVQAVIAKHRIY